MPKKKPSEDAGINMDVMMDSMTNVVGVLLLILIIVQIQISTAVETIETVLKNVTKQDLQKLETKIAEQNKNIENVNVDELNQQYQEAMGDVDEAQMRVNLYTSKDETKRAGLVDVRKLIEMKFDKTSEKEIEQNIFTDLSREKQRLAAALAKTPLPKLPDGVDIIVPAGLPLPKGAKIIKVMCIYNRLYFIQDGDYKKMAENFLKDPATSVIYTNYVSNGKTVTVYDHKKTYNLLSTIATNLNAGNTNFTITTYLRDYENRVRIDIRPDKTGGMTVKDLEPRDNQFRQQVLGLRRDPKNVIWFYVYKDSLDVYFAARDVCQAVGIPQGWEYYRWTGMSPTLNFAVNPLKARTNVITKVVRRARDSAVIIKGPKKTAN